jgi:peptide/nickel transport system substrate-binding protein
MLNDDNAVSDAPNTSGYLSRRELLRRGLGAGVLLSLPVGGALAAAERAQAQAGGNVLFVPRVSPISTLDIEKAFLISEAEMLEPVYDRLVWTTNGSFDIFPGLATDWTVNSTATSFRFKLRSDAVFHDGTPVNAQAVKANFDRIHNPATGATLSGFALGSTYKSATVVGKDTVVVEFTAPNGAFLNVLGDVWLGIMSPKSWGLGAKLASNPVGSGPFKFVSSSTNQLSLERNPDYAWGPPTFKNRKAPHLSNLSFNAVSEEFTRMAILSTNKSAMIEQPPDSEVASLQSNHSYTVTNDNPGGSSHFFFSNVTKAPTNELAVRQAIAYGMNVDNWIKVLFYGDRVRAQSLLEQNMLGYVPTPKNAFSYDPDRAKALLTKAGWTGSGTRSKGGKKLSLTFIYSPGFDPELWAPLFISDMSAIGIAVSSVVLDSSAAVAAWNASKHNVGASFVSWSDPSVLGLVIDSKQIGFNNWAFLNSPQIDQLLAKGLQTIKSSARAPFYEQIVELALASASMAPLYHKRTVVVSNSGLKNVHFSLDGYPRWNDATIT